MLSNEELGRVLASFELSADPDVVEALKSSDVVGDDSDPAARLSFLFRVVLIGAAASELRARASARETQNFPRGRLVVSGAGQPHIADLGVRQPAVYAATTATDAFRRDYSRHFSSIAAAPESPITGPTSASIAPYVAVGAAASTFASVAAGWQSFLDSNDTFFREFAS